MGLFDKIDFMKAAQAVADMSDEERSQMMDMAKDMFANMQQSAASAPQAETEEDQEEPARENWQILGLSIEQYNRLDEQLKELLDNAAELEDFYDQDAEADYSASTLFFYKAALAILRNILIEVSTMEGQDSGRWKWAEMSGIESALGGDEVKRMLSAHELDAEKMAELARKMRLSLAQALNYKVSLPLLDGIKEQCLKLLAMENQL